MNYVGAGKLPILNNAPVLVLKDGKLAFVFGSPGGETLRIDLQTDAMSAGGDPRRTGYAMGY